MTSATNATPGTGLAALGMGSAPWQVLVEQAYRTGALTVVGELEGGQLLSYADPSGARLTIMTAPPFAAFAGVDTPDAPTVVAEITQLTDVLAVLEVQDDDGAPICELTATMAQGPLLVDEPTHVNNVTISALALDVAYYTSEDEFRTAGGATSGLFVSHGAAIVARGDGSTTPTAAAELALTVTSAARRTNTLTGEDFWYVSVEAPFPMDLCIPTEVRTGPEGAPVAKVEVQPGGVIAGSVLMAASVAVPPSCGDGCGSCGGSCGCGGH